MDEEEEKRDKLFDSNMQAYICIVSLHDSPVFWERISIVKIFDLLQMDLQTSSITPRLLSVDCKGEVD